MGDIVNNYFELDKNNVSVKSEILAGITTWATMSYIVVVNPSILSKAGMDFGAVMTATILTASFGTLLLGLFARYPFAVGPSMAMNGYFAYNVVVGAGHSWEQALGGAFISSLILIVLNILGIRQMIMDVLPRGLRIGTIAGIGMILAFIGLRDINLIVDNEATFVGLGRINSPETLLALLGIMLITAQMHFKIKPAIITTMLFLWSLGIAFGISTWGGIIDTPPSVLPTLFKLNFNDLFDTSMVSVVMTFVFVGLFDAAGTVITLSDQAGLTREDATIPRVRRILFCDALSTGLGSILGTSPSSIYIESGAGIAAGGKTGLSSVVAGVLFLSCLFLNPLISSIPMFAISPVLIVVGAMMIQAVRHAQWTNISEYLPAFLIMVTIPLTYSIPGGMGIGIIVYLFSKFISGEVDDVHWLIWVLAVVFVLKFIFL